MFYVAQADVENYLQISLTGNGIALFQQLQANVQDTVDLYTNRSWNITNPQTEYFDLTAGNAFFPKYHIDPTPYNNAFPQAGGVRSITVGAINGQGGNLLDLTYVYNYGTHIKFFSW